MIKLVQSLSCSQVKLLSLTIWRRKIQVVRVDGYEADDVVATLTEQVLQKGYRVVIASPDKDFKQLISDDVQLVMPIPEIGRWSFYTLRHYVAQYKCDPTADLSLSEYISLVLIHDLCSRWGSVIFEQLMNLKSCCTGCFMGDEADGVPGIQHLVPGFGRKTAVKLLQKHGSLENLLNTAAIRTVGKDYAQDALTKHADYLRKNYEVLSLKRYEFSNLQ
jgi:5'-3' exonuclease